MFIASFVASLASATIAYSGSLLLLSMSATMPITFAISIHAVVTFAGNLIRSILLRRFINYKIVLLFAGGAVLGILLAAPLIGRLSPKIWGGVLGTFLLLSTWWKPRTLKIEGNFYSWLCGVLASFMSVFVGAAKPFVAIFLNRQINNHQIVVATTNACSIFPQMGKIILFSMLGTAFMSYWPLIIGLLTGQLLGAYTGRFILIRDSSEWLAILLKVFCSILGVNLILKALPIG